MYRRTGKTPEDSTENAIKSAISILAYKENTEKELFDKLVAKGFSKEKASEAVAFVVEKKYLCEHRYFLRFVEFYGNTKHLGKRRILREARRKGFSENVIDGYFEEALSQVNFDEGCYGALCRCKSQNKEKACAMLLRRGYTVGNLHYALDKYEEQHGQPFGSGEEEGADLDLDEEEFDE